MTDPAVKAADALNRFFQQLEVPCRVEVDEAKGKHVVATRDEPAGGTLVEEVPFASWPCPPFLRLQRTFCFQCLRQERGVDGPTAKAWSPCSSCSSSFCSETCRATGQGVHDLLCSSLAGLREAACAPSKETTGRREGLTDVPITLEALARCVAWILVRAADAVTRHGLTCLALEADYTAAPSSSCGLVRQIFEQAAAPFNRLVGAPDGAEFPGVELTSWVELLQVALRDRGTAVLRRASQADDPDAALNASWATALVEAALSRDTLTTLLGQLALNAHAVTDYVLPPAEEALERGETSPGFCWVMKGAGVYTLLSAFNHSCEPNIQVSGLDGTHEIALRTLRPIVAGEELCITYIPLRPEARVADRRAELKDYYFVCQCPRCRAEAP